MGREKRGGDGVDSVREWLNECSNSLVETGYSLQDGVSGVFVLATD
jgi:hypothetical protein